MNKKIFTIVTASLLILFSCEQKFTADPPEIISFTYETAPSLKGEFVTFNFELLADNAVIWYGVIGSDYQAHTMQPSLDNRGSRVSIELNDSTGTFFATNRFRYDTAGVFTAVLVATRVGDLGETVLTETANLEVEVNEPPEDK